MTAVGLITFVAAIKVAWGCKKNVTDRRIVYKVDWHAFGSTGRLACNGNTRPVRIGR